MQRELTAVLDIGKTLSKLSLWGKGGELIDRRVHKNAPIDAGLGYRALDTSGTQTWMISALADFAQQGLVTAIVPVAHGAAAAVLRDGMLAAPPIDYETQPCDRIVETYREQRDEFAITGSPLLPVALNLGLQLHLLEDLSPNLLDSSAQIVTYPQYWAWFLSGVAATEVTSLGCHSDLWQPSVGKPSPLAHARGWARRLAPLRPAGAVLGVIRPELAEATGLPRNLRIFCGLHDSNAALLAARGFPGVEGHETTLLSTGTWFVAMRTPALNVDMPIAALDEHRDCLVNVDAEGRPIPSARFMGGREIELLTGLDSRRIDIRRDQPMIMRAATDVIKRRAMVMPCLVEGSGPYPDAGGGWQDQPVDAIEQRAAVALYAALMSDTILNLAGARRKILVEGRFADSELFVGALAALRPQDAVYLSHAHNDVSFGALRLVHPDLRPDGDLKRVRAIDSDVSGYAAQWHCAISHKARAA